MKFVSGPCKKNERERCGEGIWATADDFFFFVRGSLYL